LCIGVQKDVDTSMVCDVGYHVYFAAVSRSQPKKKQRTEVEDQGGPVGDNTFGVSFSKSVMRPQKIELQEGEGAFTVA
jgi:galactose mutarotase-like enzyme